MKCHVSWRHLVWNSDSLHKGTFFVHPFFSRSSSLPSSSSFFFKLNDFLLQSFPIFNFFLNTPLFFIWAFTRLCIQWDYTNTPILAVHCLIWSVYAVSNLVLFSTVSPVCSASDISKCLSSVSGAFARLRKATIRFIVVVRLSVWP